MSNFKSTNPISLSTSRGELEKIESDPVSDASGRIFKEYNMAPRSSVRYADGFDCYGKLPRPHWVSGFPY